VIGWEEPIVQGGKLVGHKRRYSDSLLRLLVQRGMVRADAAAAARPMSPDELVAEAERAAKAVVRLLSAFAAQPS
jgi:hypothetical protein